MFGGFGALLEGMKECRSSASDDSFIVEMKLELYVRGVTSSELCLLRDSRCGTRIMKSRMLDFLCVEYCSLELRGAIDPNDRILGDALGRSS